MLKDSFTCEQETWEIYNSPYFSYYYDAYPFLLQNGITLPIDKSRLEVFYINDQLSKNLTPQATWVNCYEALFSYFLGVGEGVINTTGRSFLELTAQNLPGAFNKTMHDITNPFGVPIWLWALLGVSIYIGVTK